MAFARFPHWKVTIFTFSFSLFFKTESLNLMGWGLQAYLLEKGVSIYIHYLKFFCKDVCLLPYLFIQLSIYVNIYLYVIFIFKYFILWVIIQYCYLFSCSDFFQCWPLGSLSDCPVSFSTKCHFFFFFLCLSSFFHFFLFSFKTSLLSGNARWVLYCHLVFFLTHP